MAEESEDSRPLVEKISLNNEIIRLRPAAQNAKINFIRKLTRQIAKLKVEKCDMPEELQQKRKSKIEKLMEEIHIAKPLDKDVITIAALIYSPKEAKKILESPTATVKEKLLIKIAAIKVLVSGVEKMLAKYQPIDHKQLEKVVSSIGVKKKKRKRGPRLIVAKTAESSEYPAVVWSGESGSEEEEIESDKKSKKLRKKAKHDKIHVPGSSSDEEDIEPSEASENDCEDHDIKSNKKLKKLRKKAKHDKIHVPGSSSDEEDIEPSEASENDCEDHDIKSDKKSKKLRKKAKHDKIHVPGSSSDEEDIEPSEASENDFEDHDIKSDKKSKKLRKKAKHDKIHVPGSSSDEEDFTPPKAGESDCEDQDIKSNKKSKKLRKKAKHDKIQVPGPSSEEEDIEIPKADQVKHSSKKKRNSESKDSLDEEEADNEFLNDSKKHKKRKELTGKKEKSKSKSINDLQDDETLSKKKSKHRKSKVDAEDALEEEDPDTDHKSRKKRDRDDENADSDKSDMETLPSKPRKGVVLSTRAIRFADLLAMESESTQPNVEPELFPSIVDDEAHAPEIEKEVDGFFVGADGRNNVLAWKPRKHVSMEQRNKKLEKIRAKYLEEFGAVPNRHELKRIEREGLRESKIFKKLVVKEKVDNPERLAAEQVNVPPPRMYVRKATFDDVPVHPSWEAKNKTKEMLAVPFQGKKIKFE